MAKPTALFPTTAFGSYQEVCKHLDTKGAFAQKADIALTASYAAYGAITLTGAAGAFTTWPSYGFIENQTQANHEIMLYYSNDNTNLLVKSTGRALDGTTIAASTGSTDSIRFIEARVLGLAFNQILAEIGAIEGSLVENIDVTNGISPYTVLASNSGKIHTNSGTTTIPTLNLPAMTSRLRFPILVVHSAGIKVVANGSNFIRIEGVVTKAGGYIQSVDPDANLLLVGTATANTWIGMYRSGIWTLETA